MLCGSVLCFFLMKNNKEREKRKQKEKKKNKPVTAKITNIMMAVLRISNQRQCAGEITKPFFTDCVQKGYSVESTVYLESKKKK